MFQISSYITSDTMGISARNLNHWAYGMLWYGMVWYGMVWYGMVWYGTYRTYRTIGTYHGTVRYGRKAPGRGKRKAPGSGKKKQTLNYVSSVVPNGVTFLKTSENSHLR